MRNINKFQKFKHLDSIILRNTSKNKEGILNLDGYYCERRYEVHHLLVTVEYTLKCKF